MKQKPILYGRSLFEVILCCTSGFKANCMHQSLLSCSKNGLGPADRSNHKSVIKSQFPQLSWQRWLRNDGCIIAESHCMLYNWVSISTNSLQLDLSMDLEIGELVVKPMKQKPILYGRSLFEVILCCTSGFKANCMHQSLLSCSKNGLGPADRSNHKSVIKSQFPQLSWQRWLRNDGCIIAESHCMLYNWVSISTNSLQLDLSMLTLKLMNWSKP